MPRDTEMLTHILHAIHQLRDGLADQGSRDDAILRALHHQERLIMALTANEQAAVNDLSAAVETLATDLGDVTAAATAAVTDLRAQVAALTAAGTADAATIAAMTATIDSMEADVTGALAPITARVSGIDAGLKSPVTPDAPLSVAP